MKKLLILVLTILTLPVFGQVVPKQNPADFLPIGFVISEKITGDLNKDGFEDCVLVIKGTDTSKCIIDEYHVLVDRNRRGIIVLFNKKDHYEMVVKNIDCFSSDNEDGNGYLPPELFIEIKKGNLFVHYGHGRYGYWRFTFRFQHSDIALIGFDESDDSGPVVNAEISINFLTKRKLEKVNINKHAQGGDEVFTETWKKIQVNRLIQLSAIKDFDTLRWQFIE